MQGRHQQQQQQQQQQRVSGYISCRGQLQQLNSGNFHGAACCGQGIGVMQEMQ
jgi:hypothetical protein